MTQWINAGCIQTSCCSLSCSTNEVTLYVISSRLIDLNSQLAHILIDTLAWFQLQEHLICKLVGV